MQTMIFEPKTLKLHLAIGPVPTSRLKMKTLELKPLFDRHLKQKPASEKPTVKPHK